MDSLLKDIKKTSLIKIVREKDVKKLRQCYHKDREGQSKKKCNIDKWLTLGKVLGKGTFSHIRLAESKHCRKSYALKVSYVKENEFRIDNEYKIMKYLQKEPFIPQVLDFFQCGCPIGEPYQFRILIMEALACDLEYYILKEYKDWDWWKRFLKQFITYLMRLEELGVVKFDNHQQNIMFDKKGQMYLIDWNFFVVTPPLLEKLKIGPPENYSNDGNIDGIESVMELCQLLTYVNRAEGAKVPQQVSEFCALLNHYSLMGRLPKLKDLYKKIE
jgi:serine/threonine protein kinase